MSSRFATFFMFVTLACLTSIVSGQSVYYPAASVQPHPAGYPQTNLAGGWNAGSPTGIATSPQRLPQASVPNAMVAGYAPGVSQQFSAQPGYYHPATRPASQHWSNTGTWVAPPARPTTGYFSPLSAPAPRPNYFPVSNSNGGPTAGPPLAHVQPNPGHGGGPAVAPEGSVLNQTAPAPYRQEMQNQGPVAPYDGSFMAGGTYYSESATPGMYGTSGACGMSTNTMAGYGVGNARFGYGNIGCTSPWFIGFGGLAMTRDNENHYLFSYDSANESLQLTNARNANFDWAGGLEVNFGRMFNCGQNAVEAVYWGLFPSDGVTTTTDGDVVGNLNGILNWDQLNYGLDPLLAPRTADEFVNNSTMHMVQRQSEIHNIEVNLLTFLQGGYGAGGAYGMYGGACGKGGCGGAACGNAACGGTSSCKGGASCGGASHGGGCGGTSRGGYAGRTTSLAGLGYGGALGGYGVCGSRWSHDWLVGVRFFSFRDHLLFGAEETGGNGAFGDEDDEIYYNIDITNHLVGAQLGFSGAYAVSCQCSLDYGVKLGLFGNQISHTSEIGGSQGVATINNGPNAGLDFFVQNTKKDVAFLGEANLGVSWRFGNCWSAKVGYRAVAVTGVALPTNQIYHDLRGIQDVRWVDSNGSLILHGGYARAEYRF